MELEGRINPALTLPEVLQFLSMGKMTGTLAVAHGTNSVTLTLRSGRLINSSSLRMSRKLGQILINRGTLLRSQIEEALAAQKAQAQPEPLGRILIGRGLITEDELRQSIRLQLEEEMWDLFGMQEGSFKFEHAHEGTLSPSLVELDIEPLIMEGMRRLDEWARIVKNIPSDLAVPGVNPKSDWKDREQVALSEGEWKVFSLLNGFYDMSSISSRSGLGRFETFRTVNSLLASGLVAICNLDELTDARAGFQTNDEFLESTTGAPPQSEAETGKPSPQVSSSARIVSVFRKKRDESDPAIKAAEPGSGDRYAFPSPVSFFAALANKLVRDLAANSEFYLGPQDDALGEMYWRKVVMHFPKADLVRASGNLLDTIRFERYLESAGLHGEFRSIYEDTMEGVSRYLKMLFLAATQRIGAKAAQSKFSAVFTDFRSRSDVAQCSKEEIQELASKIIA